MCVCVIVLKSLVITPIADFYWISRIEEKKSNTLSQNSWSSDHLVISVQKPYTNWMWTFCIRTVCHQNRWKILENWVNPFESDAKCKVLCLLWFHFPALRIIYIQERQRANQLVQIMFVSYVQTFILEYNDSTKRILLRKLSAWNKWKVDYGSFEWYVFPATKLCTMERFIVPYSK